ncbi:MAG TPA: oligosaccharide flippase family protein [Acetobacteraceae bacterium]
MSGRPARDVFWSAVEAAASAGFSLASALVVARIIGPAELGVGAAVVAVNVLLWVGVNALFADAMVQRATLDETAAASAFWASSLVGAGAALAEAGSAWPLAWVIGDKRLIGMSLLLAATLPIVGAAGAAQGRITRRRGYRLLACRALLCQGAGTVVGIGCAMAGAGAWGMAAQQATTSIAGALTLLLGGGWRPGLICRWAPVWDMLRLGAPLTASTLVQSGRYRLFALLIGGTAGTTALGEVHLAFRLVDTVRELAFTALWRLMLPGMAEQQNDRAALRYSVDRWLRSAGLVVFPVFAGMAVTVQPLTHWLLGVAWAGSALAALPLIALSAWLFLSYPAGVAAVARAAPQYALRGNLISCAVLVAAVAVLRPESALSAALVWLGAQVVATPYMLHRNARVLGAGAVQCMWAGFLPLALAASVGCGALLATSLAGVATPFLLLMTRGTCYVMLLVAAVIVLRLAGTGWSSWPEIFRPPVALLVAAKENRE